MNEAQSSDPVDPLQGCRFLALFPQSFKVIPDPSKPYDFDHDLQVIHTKLNSMDIQHSPSKLKYLAQNTVSCTSEILKSDNPQALKQKNEVVPDKAKENPRERRPALGRKRARFSMKPNSSQISMDLLPPFDPEKYEDLEEKFKALERHKYAEKEIKKQMGVLGADQHNPSLTKRTRRPGILGRSVKDKHNYPPFSFEISENGISQHTFETSIYSPLNHNSHTEPNENVALDEMGSAGSIAKAENKMKDNLDELLSRDCEDLEADNKAVSHLQELFKSKSIELEPLCFPEFPSKQKVDIKSSRRTLSQPTNVLTDIDNLVERIGSKSPAKRRKVAERSIHLASPTPPKSPFASLSALKKRILESYPSRDPFSAHDIDQLPVTNPSLVENGNKQPELVDTVEQTTVSGELKSPLTEQTDNIEVVQTDLLEMASEGLSHVFERSVRKGLSKLGAGFDVGSSRSHVDIEDDIGRSNMDNRVMDDTLSSPSADIDTWENETKDGDKVEDTLEEAVARAEPELNVADSTLEKSSDYQNQLDQLHSAAVEEHPAEGLSRNVDTGLETHNEIMQEHSGVSLNKQIKENSCSHRKQKSKEVSKRQSRAAVEEHPTDGLSRNVDTGPETRNKRMQEHSRVSLSTQTESNSRRHRKQKSKVSNSQSLADRLHAAAVEEHPADDLARNVDTGLETHNEIMQESSGVSLNTQIKSNSRPHKKQKRKEVSKRHSLAGAGTLWQSGVRRSTRIKTRPLEYWRGERLLYGRIHESMATVIGIKYASPGKGDGGAPLKVKSFVSDEYKELVDFAALH